ncbi:MAG: hypothetical protein HC854_16010 [Flavobacterium sp.]|nr:hypothetical protein [Flavobacterium sp.]
MKNLNQIFLFLTVVFSVISCNNDDTTIEEQIVSSNKTIKKYSEKIYYNNQIDYQFSADFNYSQGKLISISDSQNVLEFNYNSNKITQIKKYTNNQLVDTNNLSYDGDLLRSITNESNDEKTTFSYVNGVLSSQINQYLDNQTWITHLESKYTFQMNNIQQLITKNFSFSSSNKSTFEYDEKNNPMRNMNIYLKYILQYETCDFISKGNLLKQYSYSDIDSSDRILSHEYVITYDSDNYPTLVKKYGVFNGQQNLISEAVIEYNN